MENSGFRYTLEIGGRYPGPVLLPAMVRLGYETKVIPLFGSGPPVFEAEIIDHRKQENKLEYFRNLEDVVKFFEGHIGEPVVLPEWTDIKYHL